MYFAPVRKLINQRDDLINQRNLASQIGAKRVLHHQPQRNSGNSAITQLNLCETDDSNLISRTIIAYKKAIRTNVGSEDSMWLNQIQSANEETHRTLESGDTQAIVNMLRNPSNSMLLYGFDSNFKTDANKVNEVSWWAEWLKLLAYDSLLQLSRAIGIRRVEYPESGIESNEAPDVELLLQELDSKFGFKIDFPNVFPGEIGLDTSRGIANIRAVYALHQAYRIRELMTNKCISGWEGGRVIEIGAGLGRTAYYAIKMGIKSYTIIDLPLTNVAQSYYLGRVLGSERISLYTENHQNQIAILPPIAFHELDEHYDLILNVDSMTEMAKQTACDYLDKSSKISPLLLSINHEYNSFTIMQLLKERNDVKFWRSPYWLRRGYVEEIIEFI